MATIHSQNVSITSDMFNYSFKPEMERKFQLFAEFGFKYLHWCDDWNNRVIYTQQLMENYRQLPDSCGLKCLDVHGATTESIHLESKEKAAINKYIQLLENRIEFCSILGGDAVVIHPPGNEDRNQELNDSLERSLQVFEHVRPLCEDLGITLALENCYPSDEKILKYYFARYPPEFVGLCFDSGHAHLNQNLESLFQFADRLKVLHLHDNKGKTDAHQPPFWGTLDWEKVMQWLKGIKYTKPLNFEISHRPDLFDGTMEDFLAYTTRLIRAAIMLLDV